MEIKIEKGIELHPRKRAGSGKYRRAFSLMEIGDSFTVEKMNQAVRASAVAKQDGYKCATRKQPDGTYRVWRIK